MVKYVLDDTMYLINTDTGGQTHFQELMSSFILGPALNLIFSRLTDSLEDEYKIYTKPKKPQKKAKILKCQSPFPKPYLWGYFGMKLLQRNL